MKTNILLWLLFLRVPAVLCAAEPARPPNIVLILTDDMGYGDIGIYNPEASVRTPHLDQMAEQGAVFTDFYMASSICSPSRAALFTGKYPTRVGVPEVVGPNAERFLGERLGKGMPQGVVTVAEVLKARGYATALIGKWHLGHEEGFQPLDQGFDTFFGIPYSNDMGIVADARLSEAIHLRNAATVERIRAGAYAREKTNPSGRPYVSPEQYFTPLMEGRYVVEFPADQRAFTRRFTDETIRFMERNSEQPFFVVLSHPMPHVPLAASSAFIGRSDSGPYGDVIEELDAETGRLLDAIEAMGLTENTLVIFTSDNGPWKMPPGFGGTSEPLRGYKFLTHEGGHRVPMLLRWPGTIPAGTVVTELATALDFFPTFARMADAEIPTELDLDGFDFMPLLSGDPDVKSAYDAFFYLRGWQVQAVRRGDWKLQLASGGSEYRLVIPPDDPGALYDLRADKTESVNLIGEHPAIAEELRRLITDYQQQVDRDRTVWE